MYKTICYFEDLEDNRHAYNIGDVYPRKGLHVSEERIAELLSNKNRRKQPMIEEVANEQAEEVVENKPKKKKEK